MCLILCFVADLTDRERKTGSWISSGQLHCISVDCRGTEDDWVISDGLKCERLIFNFENLMKVQKIEVGTKKTSKKVAFGIYSCCGIGEVKQPTQKQK